MNKMTLEAARIVIRMLKICRLCRLKMKCEYIRQNPVRKELLMRPEEYQWLWVEGALCGAAAPAHPCKKPQA